MRGRTDGRAIPEPPARPSGSRPMWSPLAGNQPVRPGWRQRDNTIRRRAAPGYGGTRAKSPGLMGQAARHEPAIAFGQSDRPGQPHLPKPGARLGGLPNTVRKSAFFYVKSRKLQQSRPTLLVMMLGAGPWISRRQSVRRPYAAKKRRRLQSRRMGNTASWKLSIRIDSDQTWTFDRRVYLRTRGWWAQRNEPPAMQGTR